MANAVAPDQRGCLEVGPGSSVHRGSNAGAHLLDVPAAASVGRAARAATVRPTVLRSPCNRRGRRVASAWGSRPEAREPAGVRLGRSGDAVRAEKVAIGLPARADRVGHEPNHVQTEVEAYRTIS